MTTTANFETVRADFAKGGLVAALRHAWRQFVAYRLTLAELNELDDREIQDLGLSRAQLRDIAREVARQA